MMPQTEGPALIAPCQVLQSGLETEVASDVQQTAGEVTARSAREESSSADTDMMSNLWLPIRDCF